jgi:hypothetical protein
VPRSHSSRSPTISITHSGPHDVLWNRIPDDHAALVGRFIAAWSLIEFKLECLIWHLIGGDQRDLRRLTARLEHRPKEETIDELFAVRKPPAELAEAWKKAKAVIWQLVSHRNFLAHGVWVPYPIGSVGVMQTRKGGIINDQHGKPADVVVAKIAVVETTEIEGWIDDARHAVDHLNKLLDWEGSQPSSPEKP